MNFVAIIPARGGSKGIIGKNKKLLLGKPLIQYTLDAALASSQLKLIIVSTDDQEIADLCLARNVEVQFRPEHLCGDLVPTLPVLQHVLLNSKIDYDAVLTLQPTSPLRTSQHIIEAVTLFKQNQEADSLVSVVKVPHNFSPESLMKMEGNYLFNYLDVDPILRRQDKKTYFARNGAAIYITKRQQLEKSILGGKIIGYEMSAIDSLDIDTMEDWEMAELILSKDYKIPEE